MSTELATKKTDYDTSVVAFYRNHADAEAAVHCLTAGGIPMSDISALGRDFKTTEDVLGFYHPTYGAIEGAETGAWYGGMFGLIWSAMGLFVVPVIGPLVVLGPLAGMIAGAIGGAGLGVLINVLVAAGVPKDDALKYQARLHAGEFLLVVRGNGSDIQHAIKLLETTNRTHLHAYSQREAILI